MRLRLESLGIALGLVAAAACSSNSSQPVTSQEAGPNGGQPGDSSLGAGDDASDSAVATAPPIMCGSATCSAPTGAMFPLLPCCLPNKGCGATFGTGALSRFDAGGFDASGIDFDAGAFCFDTARGTPDTTCPSQAAMNITLAGCCDRSGLCGVDLSLAGLGCDSLSVLASLASTGSAGDGAVVGPPKACGANADGGVADTGAPDGSRTGDAASAP